jgi:hypothetical protein
MSSKINFVSLTGMFEYMLDISKDVYLVVGVIRVCFSFCMRWDVFWMLNAYGRGTRFASLDISNMYSNIPVKETKLILEDILRHNLIDHQTEPKQKS